MEKYLAHVTQTRMVLSQWRFGRFMAHFPFASDERGEAALDAFLSNRKLVSIAVLLDLPDERFLPGSVPHVRGADARRLKYRELRRAFPNSDYCRVEYQDRYHDGRRDDRILCSGFDSTAPFDSWFRIFLRHSVRISRLYSPALLAPGVLRQMEIRPAGSCLMVTRGLSGFRQTLVVDGWTRFSRIFDLDSSTPEAFWQGLENEQRRAMDYFHSHALLDHTSPLQTLIVADSSLLPDVRKSPHPDTIVASARKSELQGVREVGLGVPDVMALRSLAGIRLAPGYPLQESLRNFASQSRARQCLDRGAVAVAFTGVLILASQFQRSEDVSQRNAELQLAVHESARKIATLERQIMSVGLPDPEQMQIDLRLQRQLQQRANGLHEMLDVLSVALLSEPQVIIDRLAWTLVDNLDSHRSSTAVSGTVLSWDVVSDGVAPHMQVVGHSGNPLADSVVGKIKALQTLFAKLEKAGLRTKLHHSMGLTDGFSAVAQSPADSSAFSFEMRKTF